MRENKIFLYIFIGSALFYIWLFFFHVNPVFYREIELLEKKTVFDEDESSISPEIVIQESKIEEDVISAKKMKEIQDKKIIENIKNYQRKNLEFEDEFEDESEDLYFERNEEELIKEFESTLYLCTAKAKNCFPIEVFREKQPEKEFLCIAELSFCEKGEMTEISPDLIDEYFIEVYKVKDSESEINKISNELKSVIDAGEYY